MTLFRYDESSSLSKREHFALILILFTIGIFTILDIFEDWEDGSPLSHIIPEFLMIVLAIGVALYLLRGILRNRKGQLEKTRYELKQVKDEATAWKLTANSLRAGISDAISKQFKEWGLTPAENEVAFLILKGLSLGEIANVRETSERTIRHQSSEIYRKSGLDGRAQLSAFFLEDLFDQNK